MSAAPVNDAGQDRLDLLADRLADHLLERLPGLADLPAAVAFLADRQDIAPPIAAKLTPEQTRRVAAYLKSNFTPSQLARLKRSSTVRRWVNEKSKEARFETAQKVFGEFDGSAELADVLGEGAEEIGPVPLSAQCNGNERAT